MKNILLISIGSQAFILPEALAWPEVEFDEVHILTTDQAKAPWNKDKDIHSEWGKIIDFVEERWQIPVHWSMVKNIPLIQTGMDHMIWTEVLFRWAAEKYGIDINVYYCLSGGTKTMPASFQQAAKLFGANELFHVLAHPAPKSIEEVKEYIVDEKIEYVLMGAESGWDYLLNFAQQHPNKVQKQKDSLFTNILPPETLSVTDYINESQSSVRQFISGHKKGYVPFASLLLLSKKQIEWLRQPLEQADKEWVQSLPKIDLHNHLGGFATSGKLLNQVRAAANNSEKIPDIDHSVYPQDKKWPLPSHNIDLSDYMRAGDNNGSTLLRDPGCLKKHIELMYQHFIEDNVRYVELRCSPNNYSKDTPRSAIDVLEQIIQVFDAQMKKHQYKCIVKLLIIVTRKYEGDLSDISKHLALAITSYFSGANQNSQHCSVVGVDLAGYEFRDTRAEYFQHDFNSVHRCGLAVTAHAGENDDAEGIWQAVYKLHSRRIGHGLRLLEAPDLLRSIIDRGIGIEMCPYANYQIVGFSPMKGKENTIYPLQEYLNQGVKVSVNTDNMGISQATLSDNYLLLHKLCRGLTRMDILRLIKNSIEMSFCGKQLQNHLTEQINENLPETIYKLFK